MHTLRADCPNCQAAGRVPISAIGKRCRCPQCRFPFTVVLSVPNLLAAAEGLGVAPDIRGRLQASLQRHLDRIQQLTARLATLPVYPARAAEDYLVKELQCKRFGSKEVRRHTFEELVVRVAMLSDWLESEYLLKGDCGPGRMFYSRGYSNGVANFRFQGARPPDGPDDFHCNYVVYIVPVEGGDWLCGLDHFDA